MTSKDPVDAHIGNRLRNAREMRHMTLVQVGRSLGLTYQQIRKYESGENRLSASRLYHLSLLFKVEPAYFFIGLGPDRDEPGGDVVGEPGLYAALSRIDNSDVRHQLRGLIEVLDVAFAEEAVRAKRPDTAS